MHLEDDLFLFFWAAVVDGGAERANMSFKKTWDVAILKAVESHVPVLNRIEKWQK